MKVLKKYKKPSKTVEIIRRADGINICLDQDQNITAIIGDAFLKAIQNEVRKKRKE